MDNDDAMMQTRFSHIETRAISTEQVNKSRRGAVRKKPGRLNELSEVNEDEAGSDEDVQFDPFDKLRTIATEQVNKGRRGAARKKPGRLTELSEVKEDEAGSDEDV